MFLAEVILLKPRGIAFLRNNMLTILIMFELD